MPYDLRLMMDAARMYYVAKINQQEIAKKLKISRPTLSRILRQAEEEGIIQITVVDPFNDVATLENRLIEEFGLKDACVVINMGQSANKMRTQLGKAGAEYLVKKLKPRDILGVAWGATTMEVARHMPHDHIEGMRVVSLIGCTYENTMDEGLFEVARVFGRKLGAELYHLYTPVIVSSPEVKQIYLSDNHTRRTMEYIAYSNITPNGIGNFGRESMLYRYGYISDEKRAELAAKGTVGNFCSLYYDIDGNPVDPELNARTIGVSLEEMRIKESSIGIAAGVEKRLPFSARCAEVSSIS